MPVRPASGADAGVSPAIGAADTLHQAGNADPKLKDVRLDLFMPYAVTAMIGDGFAAPLLWFPHFLTPYTNSAAVPPNGRAIRMIAQPRGYTVRYYMCQENIIL